MPVITFPYAVRNILRFIFTGLVFSATGEYLFSVVVRGNLADYLSTIPTYTLYLLLVYALSRPLFRLGNRFTSVGVYYLATGCVGLMIEWFLIGNAPWDNTHANQVGMFAYWTSLTMMPVIFTDDRPHAEHGDESESPRHHESRIRPWHTMLRRLRRPAAPIKITPSMGFLRGHLLAGRCS